MHIEELQLENFRGFAPLTIPFERHLTVLVGVNGAGKSSILDALATMFVLRLHSDALPSEPRDFTDRDVRVGCDDAQVTCRSRNAFGKDYYDWTRSFVGRVKAERKSRDSVGRTGMLKDSPETALVPVLAIYYPSRRSVIDTPERL